MRMRDLLRKQTWHQHNCNFCNHVARATQFMFMFNFTPTYAASFYDHERRIHN